MIQSAKCTGGTLPHAGLRTTLLTDPRLARRIYGSLENKTVFLVGAGKMAELAVRHLLEEGSTEVFVANRTFERAERLAAQYGGQAIRFNDLYATAGQADIIITSTCAPQAIFRKDHAQHFLDIRRRGPICFIDIAVPRDVDPEVSRLQGAFLYNIDDLQSVASRHIAERREEVEQCEAIISAEVTRYQRYLDSLHVVPEILRLQQVVEECRKQELRRLQARLEVRQETFSTAQHAALETLTRSLTNKLLHHPLKAMKAAARAGDTAALDTIRTMLGLNLTGRYGYRESGNPGRHVSCNQTVTWTDTPECTDEAFKHKMT